MNVQAMQKRREDIRKRIAAPAHASSTCAVLGCGKATAAKEGSGLNRSYCRAHVEHHSRHGSYSKRSYAAGELTPRRVNAFAWLAENRQHPDVREAVERIRTLYWRGGRPEEVYRLAGQPPERRAMNCWARLRLLEVDPLHALAAWLGVVLCHRADLQPERKIEFRWVQSAKVVFRMSGGSHKRWERTDSAGRVSVLALHRYPASRGRVLRHIGAQLARAAKPLEVHLGAVETITSATARLPRAKRRGGG